MEAMHNARTMLNRKKVKGIVSVTPSATVQEAVEAMNNHNTSSVLVMNGQSLEGIFTERDNARKVTLAGKDPKSTPVTEVMTPGNEIVTVSPFENPHVCSALMDKHDIRHIVVAYGGTIEGVISQKDLMRTFGQEVARFFVEFWGYDPNQT